MLIGSSTRYIVGRNAIQTVYWRTTGKDSAMPKFVKNNKTCHFGKISPPTVITNSDTLRFFKN